MSAPRLLHMGGAIVDFVYRAGALPAPGAEIVADSFAMLPGGGFNMMNAARACGMRVSYGGPHGTGPHGDFIRAALAEAGIPALLPPSGALDTGNCVVMVTPDGERTFLSWPGAEGRLDEAGLARIEPRQGDVVFVSGYTLSYPASRDALARWLAALDASVPVVLDPAPVVGSIPRPLLRAVLSRLTWLSANLSEAGTITGAKGPQAQIAALIGAGGLCPRAEGIVLRAGSDGAWLGLPDKPPLRVPPFQVEAVDTTGAGDTHVGAFLAALAQGQAPAAAVFFANAAAAISVTRRGGASAPAFAQVDAFLRARVSRGEAAGQTTMSTGGRTAAQP